MSTNVPFKPITNKNGRANLTYKDGELIYEAGTIPDEERVKLTKQLVDEMDDGEMTNGISDGSHSYWNYYLFVDLFAPVLYLHHSYLSSLIHYYISALFRFYLLRFRLL